MPQVLFVLPAGLLTDPPKWLGRAVVLCIVM